MYSGTPMKTFTFAQLLETQNGDHPMYEKVSSRAVEKAREWLQEGATDYEWYEYTIDMWKQALDQIGFVGAEIQFSGFWSQGDGASFTAEVDQQKLLEYLISDVESSEIVSVDEKGIEDFRGWISHKVRGLPNVNRRHIEWLLSSDVFMSDVGWKVKRSYCSGNYCHENTCLLEEHNFYKDGVEFDTVLKDLTDTLEEFRRDLCRAIYKSLDNEYEWLNSDEQLAETSEANDYRFNCDGEVVD